jgi:hypothetical protein
VPESGIGDEWPAYSEDYVLSDQPQSKAEQFILDEYPDLWGQGVRVLSPKLVPGYNYADPATPGAVVQYINGERYEGTISYPLGFRGQIADPQSLPSDTVDNVIATFIDGNTCPAGNTGLLLACAPVPRFGPAGVTFGKGAARM